MSAKALICSWCCCDIKGLLTWAIHLCVFKVANKLRADRQSCTSTLSLMQLLSTTLELVGGALAGDWCFEDGLITFRDIAQLYLRASHKFKGCVLSVRRL